MTHELNWRKTGRVAVLGGNRIPFAVQHGLLDRVNQDMLTAASTAWSTGSGCRTSGSGSSSPAPCSSTPATSTWPARRCSARSCRPRRPRPTSSRPAAPASGRDQVANKIALAQIEVGVAGGSDTTSDAPVAISGKLRKKLLRSTPPRTPRSAGRPRRHPARRHRPVHPAERRAAHRPLHGRPPLTALEWQIGREEQDELAALSHQHLAAAYDAGFETT
jgi:acetyl-CoA C-acetyltransferase